MGDPTMVITGEVHLEVLSFGRGAKQSKGNSCKRLVMKACIKLSQFLHLLSPHGILPPLTLHTLSLVLTPDLGLRISTAVSQSILLFPS